MGRVSKHREGQEFASFFRFEKQIVRMRLEVRDPIGVFICRSPKKLVQKSKVAQLMMLHAAGLGGEIERAVSPHRSKWSAAEERDKECFITVCDACAERLCKRLERCLRVLIRGKAELLMC